MITNEAPESREDLQVAVARILSECGFDVHCNQIICASRFDVEEEMASEESARGKTCRVVCDCRYWNGDFQTSSLTEFKSSIAENEANAGYIILKNKAKSSALRNLEESAIRIICWEEFQSAFVQLWYERYFMPRLTRLLEELLECFVPVVYSQMPPIAPDNNRVVALRRDHVEFFWLMLSITRHWSVGHTRLQLPISSRQFPGGTNVIPNKVSCAASYMNLLTAIAEHVKRIIKL